MSKKRAKSGGGGSAGVARWEQGLLQAQFNEEGKWSAHIAFIVGNKLEDSSHIKALNTVVESGIRRLFSVVTKEELYAQVKELGNPKSVKKGKDTPSHFEVCEPSKQYLDNNEDIPLPLLARLLKFKLLAVKQNDLSRRGIEKKADSDKDKGGKKGDKKERGKSPKKGGKKTPEPPSAKGESKLKKRGEEDLDSKYIDDEPDDGPHHYILVHGFNQPHLFGLLAEIGINVDSILKVESETYAITEGMSPDPVIEGEKDEKQLAAEEEARQQREKEVMELEKFWKDVLLVLRGAPEGSKLHDIARLSYTVQNAIIPENLEDNEKMTEFGTALFEDVACMIYNLLDSKRQYYNFLENMNLQHVPVFGQPSPPQNLQEAQSQQSVTPAPPLGSVSAAGAASQETEAKPVLEVDMRYYNDLMNSVPQESVSIPLIMHSMLEQVVATEEDKEPPSETPRPTRADGLEESLLAHISGIAFKLALSEEERQMLSSDFEPPKQESAVSRQPLLISYHDDAARRLHHLKPVDSFKIQNSESEMMQKLRLKSLSQFACPTTMTARERAARLQELIHFCATGGLTQAEIDRAFKQFVFESMDITSVDQNGFIITRMFEGAESSAIPWDDPYPFFKDMIPKHEKMEKPQDLLNPNMAVDGMDQAKSEVRATSPPPRGDPEASAKEAAKLKKELLDEEAKRPGSRGSNRSRRSKRSSSKSKRSAKSASPAPPPQEPPKEAPAVEKQEGSRPSSGILKSPAASRKGSLSSRRSSTHSVHFERDTEGVPIVQPGDDLDEPTDQVAEPDKTVDESMEEIVDAQKRLLDQWCFAEHFEPQVLLQVLKNASYQLPYMDTYYHKRDHTLLVALHNPHNAELQSRVDWQVNLHSNVGFRNYLEHIGESIDEWTRLEEAKYEATVLAQEVEKIKKEADDAASRPTSGKDKKRERSKSPKKSPSRKGSSRASSAERPPSSNPFIRAGSLKAKKEELDRLKAEEDEKEKQKQEKRARSANKKASKEDAKDDKDKKRPGSKDSSRSRTSKDPGEVPSGDSLEEPKEPEKYWPFSGYDVGNNLIHASGEIVTLFPADGGQIRTEKTEFCQGQSSVKTAVLKDGHVFVVHVLDPKDPIPEPEEIVEPVPEKPAEEQEKADTEKQEKDETGEEPSEEVTTEVQGEPAPPPIPKKPPVGSFGSFVGHFKDGMSVAVSTYGVCGEPENGKPYEPEPYVPPVVRSPSPGPKDPSPAKGRKDKGKDKQVATPEPPPQEEEEKPEEQADEKKVYQPFQELSITCPDGLCLKYYLESSVGIQPQQEDERRMLVRQSYPFKTRGLHPCEAGRKKAMEETSRVITTDGTVVKYLMNGGIEVLFADGTVSEQTSVLPPIASRSNSPQRASSAKSITGDRATPTKKAGRASRKASAKAQEQVEPPVEEDPKKGQWVTTLPQGERVATKPDGTRVQVKDALVSVASDPHSQQTMAVREDHVVMVSHPDGSTVVEHRDGTRMTTYYKEIHIPADDLDSAETGEAPEMTVENIKYVVVECPGYTTVKFETNSGECSTEFGNGTIIHASPDGSYYILHEDGGHLQLDKDGKAAYIPRPNNSIDFVGPKRELVYTMRHFAEIVCETVDNEGNTFNVKNTGETSVCMASGEDFVQQVGEEEEGEEKAMRLETGKETKLTKLVTYKQHAPRFFIIHQDGSGTELLRYQDVAEYIANAEDDLSTAILMDPLPDYPGVLGITVLKPLMKGVSDKWLKHYMHDTIMPPGLTSRDLRTLPAAEFKKEGPHFGKNVGKGLAVGSVVRSPSQAPTLKCPSILELRQIVQYKPMSEQLRQTLAEGLREYAEFVQARNRETEALLLQDPRSEAEKQQAAEIAELQEIAKAPSPPKERSMTPTGRVTPSRRVRTPKSRGSTPVPDAPKMADCTELESDVKTVYERATAPPVPSPPPTPQPKRTQADWERDQRELAEEMEGRRALREHDVPPYFDSSLGKAFLLSQAPDMAALAKELAEDTRRDSSAAIRGASSSTEMGEESRRSSRDIPTNDHAVNASRNSEHTVTAETPQDQGSGINESPSPYGLSGNTPSALRPGNPTPAHAAGQGSPAPLRPKNPTPAHAFKIQDRPMAPTPKEASNENINPDSPSSHAYPSIPEQPQEEETPEEVQAPSAESQLVLTRSLQVDVVGEPRTDPVHVPAYISGGRPGAQLNSKFDLVEDPVRRRVNTSSVAGASRKGQNTLFRMRGFELLPDRVYFGVLKEGNTYSFTVYLKNTGIDACRFRLKQPPPSTGMKVIYQPGPVAAGMKKALNIEIYAIAVGVEGETGVGMVAHTLEITTETDHLLLPISATVLTVDEYDNRGKDGPKGSRAPGVQLVSRKPPAGQGIIRPRKDVPAGEAGVVY